MIPLWAYGAAGALVAGFLGGWTVRDWKADSDALAASEAAAKLHDKLEQVQADNAIRYEQFAAANRSAVAQDRSTIREIYRNVEVPADCAAPAAAVSLLDNARLSANAAATGEPRPTLPAGGAAAGPAD